MSKKNLYLLLIFACCTGYVWLFVSFNTQLANNDFSVCLLKNITNIPCPSCGSTRSVLSILKGEWSQALSQNPLGYVVFLIMFVSPLWIMGDLLLGKSTFYHFYLQAEQKIQYKHIFIPIGFLVLANWIWNIYKEI